jgi:hypothetical protein
MNDPARVRGVQRLGNLGGYLEGAPGLQTSLTETAGERCPIDVLHDDKRLPVVLADFED